MNKSKKNRARNTLAVSIVRALTISALTVSPVFASGYHFGTQSVSAQGTANASAAEAADASTLFYNVAGLSKLEGTNISINANIVAPSVKYSNAKAFYPTYDGTPQPSITGKTSGKITEKVVVAPHLYASHQLNDKFTLGVGVYVPFGSGTEYQRDSVLRYNINKMSLKSIDINPSVSFKINDNHSIGAGIIAQYSTAELRQYANLGKLLPPPYNSNNKNGFAEIEGDDWGFGYNLAYLWDVNDKVRIGANYRSKIEHTLKGDAEWTLDNDIFKNAAFSTGVRNAGYAAKEKVSVKITTPESLSLHGMVKIDPQWTAFGDVTWTRHSRFNTLNIKYENQKAVSNAALKKRGGKVLEADYSDTTTIKPQWRDTFKIGLGASYQYSEPLELRFGIAYDQSPVKNPDYRLSTLPDNDRIWFSLGAKYDLDKNSSINLGYSYIHIKDAKANVNGFCGTATNRPGPGANNCVSSRTNGTADYKSHAHILGIQYNHRF